MLRDHNLGEPNYSNPSHGAARTPDHDPEPETELMPAAVVALAPAPARAVVLVLVLVLALVLALVLVLMAPGLALVLMLVLVLVPVLVLVLVLVPALQHQRQFTCQVGDGIRRWVVCGVFVSRPPRHLPPHATTPPISALSLTASGAEGRELGVTAPCTIAMWAAVGSFV